MKSEIWIDELIGGCKVTLVQNFIDQSEYQRRHLESCFDKGLLDDCPLVAYVDRKYGFTWDHLTQENYYFAALHTL
jgi:hypothetical protein